MSFEVVDAGALSLMQDLGRSGYQHLGVTQSGPMDLRAFELANWLLDNDRSAAQIEVTLGGLKLRAQESAYIALTGADLNASINERPLKPWETAKVKQGDLVSFGSPISGLRAYLAVQGGFGSKPVLGSVATCVRERLGGLDGEGSKLKAGDRLLIEAHQGQADPPDRQIPTRWLPDTDGEVQLDLIPGYQFQRFSEVQRARFFNARYTVSPQIDRMGYRLAGEAIKADSNQLISEGIALGSVQIPADGQPIVMMSDRQTIGGYPKLGCISRQSVSRLSQCKPGDPVRFRSVDLAEMQFEALMFEQFLRGAV